MKLQVEVLQGQDLLRDPGDRCKVKNTVKNKLFASRRHSHGLSKTDSGNSTSNSSLQLTDDSADAANNAVKGEKHQRKPSKSKSAMETVRKLASKIKSPLGGDRKGNAVESFSFATVGDVEQEQSQGHPYVWIRLKDKIEQTSVGTDKRACTWNESFEFDVTGLWELCGGDRNATETELVLEIQVRDSGRDLNYGELSIPLTRLSSSTRIKQWYQLLRPEPEEEESTSSSLQDLHLLRRTSFATQTTSEDPCGVLLLSFSFMEEPAVPSQQTAQSKRKMSISSPVSTKPHRPKVIPRRLVDYVVIAKQSVPTFDAHLAERFPALDHEDLPLPIKIEWFIFAFENRVTSDPEDVGLKSKHVINGVSVDIFTFVHAPRGVPLYGYCLMYETGDLLGESSSERTYPKKQPRSSVCIVSRLNRGDMFRQCLLEFFGRISSEQSEEAKAKVFQQLSSRLVNDVPMPLPGILGINFDLDAQSATRFSCSLENLGDLPTLTFANGLEFLINKIGISLLIELWGALLLECKVVMHASNQWMLSTAGETLLALLYPFRWPHTYVSVLPAQLLECVEAPLPYIVGIHSDLICEIPDFDLGEVVLLDLDRGVVRKGSNLQIEPIPAAESRRLFRMISQVLGINACNLEDPVEQATNCAGLCWDLDESCPPQPLATLSLEKSRQIQLCFLECICQMLQGYRECLFFLNDSMPVFNTPKFLERRGQDGMFFSRLLDTQAFERFKEIQATKWLRIFHAYFFRLKVRLRDRDHYLALSSQKRHAEERRVSAAQDPDEDDFDSTERHRPGPVHLSLIRSREARNDNVWSTRERRKGRANVPGLAPFEIRIRLEDSDSEEEFDDDETDGNRISKIPENLYFLDCFTKSTDDCVNENLRFDLETIGKECNLPVAMLRSGLHDLRAIVGVQNYQNFDDEEQSGFAVDEDSDVEGLGSRPRFNSAGIFDDGPTMNESGVFHMISQKSPNSPRAGRSIAKSIATFDADFAANQQKSVSDRRMELSLQDCITNIFLNKSVEPELQQVCIDSFFVSKYARDLFVLILFQPHHRYSYSTGLKGRGLRGGAFESLVHLCRELLNACSDKADYGNARHILELSQCYYLDKSSPSTSEILSPLSGGSGGSSVQQYAFSSRNRNGSLGGKTSLEQRRRSFAELRQVALPVHPEDYLEAHFKGLALWQSILFWEDAFNEVLNIELRKRSRALSSVGGRQRGSLAASRQLTSARVLSTATMFTAASIRTSRRNTEPPNGTAHHVLLGRQSTDFLQQQKERDGEDRSTPATPHSAEVHSGVEKKELDPMQDILFELASSMVHQMIRVGASQDKAKALVSRIISQHGLAPEHEDTLGMLISNVSKAANAFNK